MSCDCEFCSEVYGEEVGNSDPYNDLLAKSKDLNTELFDALKDAATQRGIQQGMKATIKQLEAERDEARSIVKDIYWMALRYADGRQSYAVGMVNDAVKKGHDSGWLDASPNNTPSFARDGSSKEWVALKDKVESLEKRIHLVCNTFQAEEDAEGTTWDRQFALLALKED